MVVTYLMFSAVALVIVSASIILVLDFVQRNQSRRDFRISVGQPRRP